MGVDHVVKAVAGVAFVASDGCDLDYFACDGDGFFFAGAMPHPDRDVGACLAFELAHRIEDVNAKRVLAFDLQDDVARHDAGIPRGRVVQRGDDSKAILVDVDFCTDTCK